MAHLILSRTATGSSVRFAAAFTCAFLARQGACQGAAEICADKYPNPKPGQTPKPVPAARSLSSALSVDTIDGLDLAAPPIPATELRLGSAAGGLPSPRGARGDAHGHAGADPSLAPVVRQCAPLCTLMVCI